MTWRFYIVETCTNCARTCVICCLSLSHIDGGVIEILSSSQSGSESDLYIVGVDGAKGEGGRQLARHDIIVISSDSEAARHGEDGAPL